MNILNIRKARKVSKLGQGNPCPFVNLILSLRFNINHFGDQSFIQIPFHIQNLYIIPIKFMVKDE